MKNMSEEALAMKHFGPKQKVGLSERIDKYAKSQEMMMILGEVVHIEARLASARAIMQRFVDKVDTGRARSTETYAEMKQWVEDE